MGFGYPCPWVIQRKIKSGKFTSEIGSQRRCTAQAFAMLLFYHELVNTRVSNDAKRQRYVLTEKLALCTHVETASKQTHAMAPTLIHVISTLLAYWVVALWVIINHEWFAISHFHYNQNNT